MLVDFSDDFLSLLIPSKGGTTQAVRVVLANSKEDKDFMEVMNLMEVFCCLHVPLKVGIIMVLHCRKSFKVLKRRRTRKFVDFER